MRSQLRDRVGPQRYRAVLERYGGSRDAEGQTTMLLRDVRDGSSGEIVADHLWVPLWPVLRSLGARAGETIEFRAVVAPYVKGYFGSNEYAMVNSGPRGVDFGLTEIDSPRRLDSDGIEIDLAIPRVVRTEAGWFAIKYGLLYPCDTRDKADAG